jgi:hypothetical protein
MPPRLATSMAAFGNPYGVGGQSVFCREPIASGAPRRGWSSSGPRSFAPAALDQIGTDGSTIGRALFQAGERATIRSVAPQAPHITVGYFGMDARMGRPHLDHTPIWHDATPAEAGPLAIADHPQNRDVDLVPRLAVKSSYFKHAAILTPLRRLTAAARRTRARYPTRKKCSRRESVHPVIV